MTASCPQYLSLDIYHPHEGGIYPSWPHQPSEWESGETPIQFQERLNSKESSNLRVWACKVEL